MHLHRLDLNLLVALDALLSEQSVTRAAHQLNLSQPAMSGALNRLREHFDDELIHRSGRLMVLSPFATVLAERVKAVLKDATNVAQMRPGFDPADSERSFTIVASDYISTVFLPALVRHLDAVAPGVSLHLEARSADHERRFSLGMIDFSAVPNSMALKHCPWQPLFNDEYVCVVCAGNDAVRQSISLEEFLAAGHVVRVNPAAGAATGDERLLQQLGHVRRVKVTVPTFEILPRMVVGTRLIATVQRRLAVLAAKQLNIRILTHPLEIEPIRFLLQWSQLQSAEPGHVWLREQFVIVAEQIGGGEPP